MVTMQYNRLALGIVHAKGIPYVEAERFLQTLTILIVAGSEAMQRAAGQAAVLTAVNTAQPAFLGGVAVSFFGDPPLLLPIGGCQTFRQALSRIGHSPQDVASPTISLFVGAPLDGAAPTDVVVHADGWRGGASDTANPTNFALGDADDFSLGGVFAGAAGVHRAFLRAAELPGKCLDGPFGFSLWSPADDWTRPVQGRHLENIPSKYWMLGLGHLGQAYLWNLVLLPFRAPGEVQFLLNDADTLDEPNYGSGLLTLAGSTTSKKTRVCAEWLERRGFHTAISERRFDQHTIRAEDEPPVALCGFDNSQSRALLEGAGFRFIVEAGLGGRISNFDKATINVFPNLLMPAAQRWATAGPAVHADQSIVGPASRDDDEGRCGALEIDQNGKAVSTSFVGAMVGALVVSELLRSFNGGVRFDQMEFDARCREEWATHPSTVRLKAIDRVFMGSVLATERSLEIPSKGSVA